MTITAELRTTDFGTRGSRRLLRAGRIPAVVYGKADPIHVTIDAHDYNYNHKNYKNDADLILAVDGAEHHVVVKAVQADLLRGVIHHVDFFEKN